MRRNEIIMWENAMKAGFYTGISVHSEVKDMGPLFMVGVFCI